MIKWRIIKREDTDLTIDWALYEVVGIWPFHRWEFLASYHTKEDAEEALKVRIKRPRNLSTRYYFSSGHEDSSY